MTDLGDLKGPVLLFGGPYSNLQSTEAMRAEAERLSIPPARVICTGDVVAYCGDPAATIDAMRTWGCHVVMGNCEEALSEGGLDCRCGFEQGTECDLLSVRWFAHASAAISDAQRAWMGALPHPVTFALNGLRIAVVHGHERDISEWVFASTPEAEKRVALDALDADAVVAGHSGLPFSQILADGRLWHNPGVIGVPANDGTPRVWYSVLEPAAGGIRVSHRSLEYDFAAAARRMAEEDLPDAYAKTLVNGLWPNMDVLPSAETAMVGDALNLQDFVWSPPKSQRAPRAAG